MYVTGHDPFAALGLPASVDLTDDEVRAAWRRIAAATHPDLPDGGDPSRFAAAAAAYATLRTSFGRGEAHADLIAPRADLTEARARASARPARRSHPALSAAAATADAPPGAPRTAATADASPGASLAASQASPGAPGAAARRWVWQVRSGRPVRLLLRLIFAAWVSWICTAVTGWQPATLAIAVGCLTWLIRTIRYDVAPHPGS